MPRDKRLWMTFPIDMHRHPKISRLPVTARWAFFEMNGEARMQDNDGIFPAVEAEHEWGKKILDQLVTSHPTRPLVVREGDEYRIRDYAEHQQTKADRDELAEKRAEAGKAGAAKRWGSKSMANDGKPMASAKQAVAGGMANGGKRIAESESESELETTTKTSQSSHLGNRASNAIDSTDPDLIHVSRYGIDIPAVVAKVEQVYGQTPNARAIKQMADAVFGSAKNPKNPTAVLLTSVERDGKEWRAALAGEQVKR